MVAGTKKQRVFLMVIMGVALYGCEGPGTADVAGAAPGAGTSPVVTASAEKRAPDAAEEGKKDFAAWLDALKTEAQETRRIKPAVLERALQGIKPLPRVIELDRRQPELTLSFQEYLARTVTKARIAAGRRKMAAHGPLLTEIGKTYGVPPRFIVALWGIETDFGRLTGTFPIVEALATLAYDGRRSAYFRRELLDALTILDEGHILPERMLGSWAGAMGQNQFMPSSFLRFAKDHDGDGRRDIWNTTADVFASTANYLATSGWQREQGWGRAVRLPQGFDGVLAERKVKKSLAEWAALGVTGVDGHALPGQSLPAMLVLPNGGDTPRKERAAFLVQENYEVLLKWNRSNLFALAVGHLADHLRDR
ncbi:MAG: membrane-bound lytic murein transglycosylase B [Rhodospirillaceae bacterium]|nr:MAG: membrane-bound lytic murein transglycosylase B [Rhodospirillaceae bacterium]